MKTGNGSVPRRSGCQEVDMKTTTMFQLVQGGVILSLLVCFFIATPRQAEGQEVAGEAATYNRAELTQMLAPIALYPDTLLSQILMAATYPIEVVEADRWVDRNPGLKGDALDAALLEQEWDPSVKALSHFPSVLSLMSERISETTSIGNAFLAQESEVMNTIQDLRARAHAEGNLTTDARQNVIVERETIVIQPANPRVVYVPYYDPFTVYGSWWYPDYRPWYWRPAGVNVGFGLSYWPGVYFSFNFGGWSYFDWPHRHVYINTHKRPRFVRRDRWIVRKPGRWHHAPIHRRGVAYRDRGTARKFGQVPRRAPDWRRDVRGFPERRGDTPSRVERQRQERQRIERELRKRRPAQGARSPERKATSGPPTRQRVEQGRQVRRPGQRGEQGRQVRTPAGREVRQQRSGVSKPARPSVEGRRSSQPRSVQESPVRQKVRRATPRQQQPEKSRDNVFNRINSGRQERVSGERGRSSRQGGGSDSRGAGSRSSGGRSGR
jgi:uncharacterized membrane protein YgcG